MKKKNLSLLTIISLLTVPTLAAPLEWIIKIDHVRDGTVTGLDPTIYTGNMFNNRFQLTDQTNPQDGQIIGELEAENVADIGSASTSRISFVRTSPSDSYHYLGQSIGQGKYEGSWFGPNGQQGDFEIAPPSGTTPSEPTVQQTVASATASSLFSSTYPASKAIDGSLGNNSAKVWFSDAYEAQPWLKLDMNTATEVYFYRWSRGYCAGQHYLPGTWTVHASNDDTNWALIHDMDVEDDSKYPKTQCGVGYGEMNTITNPGSYRYYKFTWTRSSSNPYAGIAIAEIQLWK